MSSTRDHAIGGATLPRGADDEIAFGSAASVTGATTAGGAELVHPVPVGHDGQDGVFPSGDEQQSTPPMIGRALTDGASREGACSEAAAAAW